MIAQMFYDLWYLVKVIFYLFYYLVSGLIVSAKLWYKVEIKSAGEPSKHEISITIERDKT